MQTSLVLSMAAFALASSISPGPVNLVALSVGASHGFNASIAHVTGATLGFVLLLLLTGLGLHELLIRYPATIPAIKWAGVLFLLYMAYRLATDDGALTTDASRARPSGLQGAAMQWLNPKAWLAAIAGMGAYASGGEAVRVWMFALIYFVVCYVSIACWACAGAMLGRHLKNRHRVRRFNRFLAALLLLGAGYLALN